MSPRRRNPRRLVKAVLDEMHETLRWMRGGAKWGMDRSEYGKDPVSGRMTLVRIPDEAMIENNPLAWVQLAEAMDLIIRKATTVRAYARAQQAAMCEEHTKGDDQ